jgi:triosephosphate isomerase
MRQKLVIGNWKMHGRTAENQTLLTSLKSLLSNPAVAVSVCVPYPYLSQVASVLAGSAITWGVQDVSEHLQGAYTGEVSAAMLCDFNVKYVLVGHSERRALYGETDQMVARKAARAIAERLVPVVCVGETLSEREADITGDVIERQLDAVMSEIGVTGFSRLVIAYEPVWAIGTGRTASVAQVAEVHALIRRRIAAQSMEVANRLQILYGGSVKPGNAAELFSLQDVDGGLIGGASLIAADFAAICSAA